nr:SUMF1/EgtB/PvdO family nonheme iron enzyme [Planctomycetota bacterium]
MTHHRTLANNFRSALMSLIVGAIAVLVPKVLVFAEPKPGELLEVKIQTPNGPVAVRFRYCPPGQGMRGRPQALPEPTGNALLDQVKRKALLAQLKGFYMSETEVSQQQLERILGQETVDNIFKRMVAGEAGGRGNEFPIRGVTVVEAAKFCESLRDFDGQNQAGGLSLEARKFRLPTHDEWQYACRGIRDVEQTLKLPHFNVWPELKDVPRDVVADCQDVWTKKLGEQSPFDGSQEQVVRVIEAHDTAKRGVEIL